MPRGIDAKSVTENTKSILTPMAGEEAIVHERLASVTSAGTGEIAVYCRLGFPAQQRNFLNYNQLDSFANRSE